MMKINGYKLVVVEWEDSALPISRWQWVEDYETPECVMCVSVGFLIAETKQAIAIAPNIGGKGTESTQACGIIRIPRAAIRKMKNL